MPIDNIDSMQVAAAEKLQLKIFVDDQELSPALTINSVPYAVVANRAESVKTATSTASAVYGYTREVGRDIVKCCG